MGAFQPLARGLDLVAEVLEQIHHVDVVPA
jgi:hypothetical protein